MPPLCLLQRHSFPSSATGWLVESHLLYVEPPHFYQMASEDPLDVNRWPPSPPLCLHSPLGGRLCSTEKCLWGSRPSVTGWHRGGLQGRPPAGLQSLASSQPTLLSPDPPLCLLTLRFTGPGLQQPSGCLHTASSRGKALAASRVPLAGYRREASSVPSPLIATRRADWV